MVHREPIADATSLGEAIARLPGIDRVAVIRMDSGQVRLPDAEGGWLPVTFVGTTDVRAGWTLVKGSSLPQASSSGEPPIFVNATLAARLHLEPGSMVTLRPTSAGAATALPAVATRVAGIGVFDFEVANEYAVATTMEGFAAAHGNSADGRGDMILVTSKPGASAAAAADIARLRGDVHVLSNDQVMEQFNENAFSYFRQISTVLSTMTLAFAFLLIATLLTMSVNQRLGEVAALRALGFPRRRIAMNLLWESALLVGVGGALAIPVGGLLAIVLDRILRHMPGVPARLHFFVFEPRALILHAALLSVTGLVAALYPIWIATRLPIAATLRREILS